MKTYTVTPIAPGLFSIYDQQTGAQLNRVNIPGQIVTGPMVSGTTCSITTKSGGTTTTYVLRLPDGAIINRFIS